MRLVVSTMKDEGPFILEWIAYYQFLGFDHFIINTNDCSDGTDKMIDRLQELGIATHLDNPAPWPNGPQASAYRRAMAHPRFKEAEWVLTCDADEFLDIKVGDHTLDSLFEATPPTDVYPFVWRLFGHSGVVAFQDKFIIDQMTMAAPLRQTWPPQARAFKSLVRMNGAYKSISTHRPKGLRPKRANRVRWTDGDGQKIYGFEYQGWSFNRTGNGFGTELARMNHYAVRSIESYLIKRQRGDVNTTSFHSKMEESGQRYWKLHCWNVVEELSMQAKIANVKLGYDKLRSDPILDELHRSAVTHHKDRIAEINKSPHAKAFTDVYRNFRSGQTVGVQNEAILDPTMALNRTDFQPDAFLRAAQHARLKALEVSRQADKLPWFANMDALEVIERSKSEATTDEPSLPEALLKAVAPTRDARNARQNRISSQRTAFLDDVSGKKRAIWALIGGTDRAIIEDLLARAEVRKLYIIEPWGMKANDMVVETVDIDDKRKALDAQFFQCVMQHKDDIKSGRLVVLRSTPQWILRLFEDHFFDVIFVNGARKGPQAEQLITNIAKKLKPAGLTIFNSYRKKDTAGLRMVEALHSYLGQHPQDWRVMGSDETHIAIEALPQQD